MLRRHAGRGFASDGSRGDPSAARSGGPGVAFWSPQRDWL